MPPRSKLPQPQPPLSMKPGPIGGTHGAQLLAQQMASAPLKSYNTWLLSEMRKMIGDVPKDIIDSIINKPAQEMQSFLIDFGVSDKEAYDFSRNLVQKKAEAEQLEEVQKSENNVYEDARKEMFPTIMENTSNLSKKAAKAAAKKNAKNDKNNSGSNDNNGGAGGPPQPLDYASKITGFNLLAKKQLHNQTGGNDGLIDAENEDGGVNYPTLKQSKAQAGVGAGGGPGQQAFNPESRRTGPVPDRSITSSNLNSKQNNYLLKSVNQSIQDLENRRVCLCQGLKHAPLSNCLHCGKINCKEEGYGPCLFCGNELIFGGFDELVQKRNDQELSDFHKAVERSKKLVQYDREAEKRTRVFDDSADWFAESKNPWLNSAQRAKAELEGKSLEKRREIERRQKFSIGIDFFGRPVISGANQSTSTQFESLEREKFETFINVDSKEDYMHAMKNVQGAGVNKQALISGGNSLAKGVYEQLKKDMKGQMIKPDLKKLKTSDSKSSGTKNDNSDNSSDTEDANNYRSRYSNREFDDMDQQASLFGTSNNIGINQGNQGFQKDTNVNANRLGANNDKSSKANITLNTLIGGVTDENDEIQQSKAEKEAQIEAENRKKKELFPAPKPQFPDGTDQGKVLTLHQPWASLIVHGFKRAEGRSWNVDGKNPNFKSGRLWIHAATKQPDENVVQSLEEYYKDLYGSYPLIPPMPSEVGGYPTGAIVGCVDLKGIYSQSEYREMRKGMLLQKTTNQSDKKKDNDAEDDDESGDDALANLEENSSDYIFWLESPRKLAVPFVFSGDHKFWDIPKASLKTLQRALLPTRWPAQGLPQQYEVNFDIKFDLTEQHLNAISESANGVPEPIGGTMITLEKKNKPMGFGIAGGPGGFSVGGFSKAMGTGQFLGSASSKFATIPGAEKGNSKYQFTKLDTHFIHLHDIVTLEDQKLLVSQIRSRGLSSTKGIDGATVTKPGFFVEQIIPGTGPSGKNPNSSTSTSSIVPKVARMSFGDFYFDHRRNRWMETASGFDAMEKKKELGISACMQRLYQECITESNKCIPKLGDRFVYDGTREFEAQVCTTTYLHPTACPQPLHQEEVVDDPDQPVVILCLGDNTKISFTLCGDNNTNSKSGTVTGGGAGNSKTTNSWGNTTVNKSTALTSKDQDTGPRTLAVSVKAGDALVFGRTQRNLFLGVQEITSNTAPPDIPLKKPGRLGVVLK